MTWKLDVCCDMMQEGLDYNQIVVTDGPMAIRTMLPLANGSCSINYCPWCGRHIKFKKEEVEG